MGSLPNRAISGLRWLIHIVESKEYTETEENWQQTPYALVKDTEGMNLISVRYHNARTNKTT